MLHVEHRDISVILRFSISSYKFGLRKKGNKWTLKPFLPSMKSAIPFYGPTKRMMAIKLEKSSCRIKTFDQG